MRGDELAVMNSSAKRRRTCACAALTSSRKASEENSVSTYGTFRSSYESAAWNSKPSRPAMASPQVPPRPVSPVKLGVEETVVATVALSEGQQRSRRLRR
jgi:hypothetical protein